MPNPLKRCQPELLLMGPFCITKIVHKPEIVSKYCKVRTKHITTYCKTGGLPGTQLGEGRGQLVRQFGHKIRSNVDVPGCASSVYARRILVLAIMKTLNSTVINTET